MQHLEQKALLAERLEFINTLLKEYKLIGEDSKVFQNKLLSFTHLDLELDEGVSYYKRVSKWLDFLTTVYVMFDLEPIILTETDSIPSVRHLVTGLFGFNKLEEEYLGLDFYIPEVILD